MFYISLEHGSGRLLRGNGQNMETGISGEKGLSLAAVAPILERALRQQRRGRKDEVFSERKKKVHTMCLASTDILK